MRTAALCADDPGAVFYDFSAAFPSVCHEFLVRRLRAVGIPSSVANLVCCLYWGDGCRLSVGGACHMGFRVRAGIRQGCPLSPLLFAVVVDPLPRKLRREHDSAEFRAYADDIASVMTSLRRALPNLLQCFGRFADTSSVRLNMAKVVIIPLGDLDADALGT